MVFATVFALSTIAWYGCTKSNREINTDEAKLYIRIAQINKDGGKSYSKVIVVNAEQ